jgi:hypothetical protein
MDPRRDRKPEYKSIPPTPEQWELMPSWLRWKITLVLVWFGWWGDLALLGLKIGGWKGGDNHGAKT